MNRQEARPVAPECIGFERRADRREELDDAMRRMLSTCPTSPRLVRLVEQLFAEPRVEAGRREPYEVDDGSQAD